ncbi:MAG TPA: hypothetical protein PLV70_06480 [Flavobacteriales bacterium]|nr:hypothetical protein [Flavobacteriales bacterium]HRN36484.1 hypothetical protein [Flavobacteriales bacterium]HRO38804.1 hypothetical protein [Flavobacteriales bacterium]HRP81624.1 hypothetical protein [Flavobacteriales bacterium]HRQ84743.1 hypothetical protein [Flavobacteriales bacterium]
MKKLLFLLLAVPAAAGCKAPAFVQAGEADGVSVAWRWNHRPGKPSELLLKIVNTSSAARQLDVALDLSFQGFTVEQFTADTCIAAGRTYNGKLNGIYFIPHELTAEQAASPDCRVTLGKFNVQEKASCP